MICRNCSAVVPDDSELCPSCGHDPAKRGRNRKTAVIVLLLSLIIFSSCVLIAVKVNRNPAGTEATTESSSSGTTAFFALKSTSVPSETTESEKESVSESGAAKSTESFRNFQVETFEISVPANETKAERARIKADKEDFLENGKEYLEFICRNIISKNSYAWLTVDFGDETGIVFLSDNTGGADYGKIDENGLIRELYGSFIISRQANYSYYPAIATASTTEPAQTGDTATSESKAPATESTVSDALTTACVTTSEAGMEKASDTAAETKPPEKKTSEPQSSKTTSAVTASSKSVTSSAVYITATGSKFHRDGCGSLSKSKIKIDRNEALEKGYEPCKRCNP